MKFEYTKQQIIEAIITIARHISSDKPDLGERMYREILKADGLPRTVEHIVYDMFTNNVSDFDPKINDVLYAAIHEIRTYAKVLNEQGEVNFS